MEADCRGLLAGYIPSVRGTFLNLVLPGRNLLVRSPTRGLKDSVATESGGCAASVPQKDRGERVGGRFGSLTCNQKLDLICFERLERQGRLQKNTAHIPSKDGALCRVVRARIPAMGAGRGSREEPKRGDHEVVR